MPTVSFLTACDPARAHHLGETASSVHAAVSYLAGRGVAADWLIVVDGPGALPRFRTGEHVTLTRLPVRAGIAAARNVALFGSRSDWVLALDADDTVNGGGVAEILDRHAGRARTPVRLPGLPGQASGIRAAAAGPAWVVADHQWHERSGAGSALTGPVVLQPGQLADSWSTGWPANVANVLVTRAAALSVGGWPALPVGEDVAFALALSERFGGACDPVPVWRRREWEGQYSRTPGLGAVTGVAAWGAAAQINEQRTRDFPDRPSVSPPQH